MAQQIEHHEADAKGAFYVHQDGRRIAEIPTAAPTRR
jgi:hypothetical protein